MRKIASIILAAGKGTRMKSERPKVTFPLAGKALVERVVETSQKINCEKIAVVVGFKKEEVIKSIPQSSELAFVEQKEQNGTGHAVIIAGQEFEDFDGDVFILCGDVPLLRAETLNDMLKKHRSENAQCTVLTAFMDDPAKYGRIVRNEKGVEKIVEFKDASDEQRAIKEINTGIYCFDSKALFDSLSKIDNNNNQNEYYLTDTLEILNNEDKKVIAIELDNIIEASGINSQKQLADLEKLHYDEIKNHWLNNGVVLENPDSIIISEDVKIENDVMIGANSIIKGESTIGKFSNIGPNSLIDNSEIEENVVLEGFNVVINTSLDCGQRLEFYQKQIN